MDVIVHAIGRIEIHDYDDDYDGFFDKCVVQLGDLRMSIDSILGIGTTILMAEDNRIFVYTSSMIIDHSWMTMKSSIDVIIVFGRSEVLTLEYRPELEVESLTE